MKRFLYLFFAFIFNRKKGIEVNKSVEKEIRTNSPTKAPKFHNKIPDKIP